MTPEKESPLRVAVIGCGQVGTVHAKAYLENPAAELVGICDINAELAEEKSRALHVPAFARIDELLEKTRPQLVSVVVPFNKMVEPIRCCLEGGVNVFAEKPISLDAKEVLSLVRLAESKGLGFGVDFNQRFTHSSRWFRQLQDAGRFGDIVWTLGYYGQSGGANFYNLREKMIHLLDLWRYFVGDVATVTGQAFWGKGGENTRSPIVLGATLQFVTGAIGVFTTGGPRTAKLFSYYELVGTEGRGYAENFVGRAVFRPKEGQALIQEPPWIGRGGTYWDTVTAHIDQIIENLLAGRPMPVPALAAFEAQCICDAIAMAIETATLVDVQAHRTKLLSVKQQ